MPEASEETPGRKCQGVSKPRSWDQRGLGTPECQTKAPWSRRSQGAMCMGTSSSIGGKEPQESGYPSLLSPQPPQSGHPGPGLWRPGGEQGWGILSP